MIDKYYLLVHILAYQVTPDIIRWRLQSYHDKALKV